MDHAIDYQALAEFRHEIRRYLNFSEQAARKAGTEPQQHQALLAIKGLPNQEKATIGRLAERLQIRHHSAVELVNRLEMNRLIRRSRSPRDQREVLLQLTQKGERRLRSLSASHRAELEKAGPRLIKVLNGVIRPALRNRLSRGRALPRSRRRVVK